MSETICPFCGASLTGSVPPSDGLVTCPRCRSAFAAPVKRKKKKELPADHPARKALERRRKKLARKKFFAEHRGALIIWGKRAGVALAVLMVVVILLQVFVEWGNRLRDEEEEVALTADVRHEIRSRLKTVRKIKTPIGGPSVRVQNLVRESPDEESNESFSAEVIIDDNLATRCTVEGTLNRRTGKWVIPDAPIDELRIHTAEIPGKGVVLFDPPKPARLEGDISEEVGRSAPRMFLVIILVIAVLMSMLLIKRFALH